ncbi:hypothetical protein Q9L58_008206 [Maublancomyces gigas]|uniref:Transposase MuDR plant domain-containing protein n=1 Tax=Discina gigas TaxID=1032678 RepID=A0ABR3GAT1_9PEZI
MASSYPIELGQLFHSWGQFKETIQDWSIVDKFQFKSLHKDRSRADYRCRTRAKKGDCPWRVYATITSKQDIRIKILEPRHTCVRATRAKRETCNSQSWLRRHVPKYLNVTRQTRPEEIQQTIKTHYGEIVNYQAAHEAKTALANGRLDQLPAYLHPPHIDTHLQHNRPPGLWFKDTSAAFLGRDTATTTSNLHHCFQLNFRNSLSPKIEPQDASQGTVKPNSTSLTLRAKHGLTTVFLFAQLSDSLLSVKSQIHKLLQENKDNIVTPISDSADEIILGAPIDQADLSKGFHILPNQDKKKTTVQDAGFKDMSVIGYKIGEDADFGIEIPRDDFDDSQEG